MELNAAKTMSFEALGMELWSIEHSELPKLLDLGEKSRLLFRTSITQCRGPITLCYLLFFGPPLHYMSNISLPIVYRVQSDCPVGSIRRPLGNRLTRHYKSLLGITNVIRHLPTVRVLLIQRMTVEMGPSKFYPRHQMPKTSLMGGLPSTPQI